MIELTNHKILTVSKTKPTAKRRRKINLPLVEVILASLVGHFVILLVLGGITIYRISNQESPEFTAPDSPEISVPPPEIKVSLTKASQPSLKPLTVTNPTQLKPPDLDLTLPKVNGRIAVGNFSGKGLGIGTGGTVNKMALNYDSFGTTDKLDYAWTGTIYFFDRIKQLRSDGSWYKDVEKKRRQSTKLYNYAFNLTQRDFTDGFPGISDQFEWFAIDFEAELYWPEKLAGDYEFRLTSDDGSILQVDGKDVIDNDGLHKMIKKTGQVTLDAGKHKFRLAYFQGPAKSIGLVLEYRPIDEANWKVFDLQDYLQYQK